MIKQGEKFQETREILDGNDYENCTFRDCKLVFNGGPIPTIVGCEFFESGFEFGDAAGRTVNLMHAIYHGMGPGGKRLIEQSFTDLREALPTPPADENSPLRELVERT